MFSHTSSHIPVNSHLRLKKRNLIRATQLSGRAEMQVQLLLSNLLLFLGKCPAPMYQLTVLELVVLSSGQFTSFRDYVPASVKQLLIFKEVILLHFV